MGTDTAPIVPELGTDALLCLVLAELRELNTRLARAETFALAAVQSAQPWLSKIKAHPRVQKMLRS